ncbi:MAG: DNA replication/repair protein RecF [Erysipelotrichaceae bacterium]
MRLESLHLNHYRNYDSLYLEFDKGMQIMTGLNAQGKTNLLEAIVCLSMARSHRSVDDQVLIQKEYDGCEINGVILRDNRHQELRLMISKQGKNLFVYNQPIRKVSDFIGICNAVMFCPDDMTLFQSSPRARRKFIDIELSKMSKTYTQALMNAHKLLKERNAYLKQPKIDLNYLEILNQQMIDYEVIVIKQRYQFLKNLMMKGKDFYKTLSNDKTSLTFEYESCVSQFEDIEKMKIELFEKYQKNLERDQLLKQTTIGFHKDDIIFKINGLDMNNSASQGQKRCALLSMKLGIVYMIHEVTKEYPILLLDDVFSELDQVRRRKLLEILPLDVQIFISTTHVYKEMIDLNRTITCWQVVDGNVTRSKEEK